jgi:hypothetical protein
VSAPGLDEAPAVSAKSRRQVWPGSRTNGLSGDVVDETTASQTQKTRRNARIPRSLKEARPRLVDPRTVYLLAKTSRSDNPN